MKNGFSSARRVNPEATDVKPGAAFAMQIRGTLLKRKMHLQDWAALHGCSLTQASLAVHGHRTDRRSREILAALEKELSR